MKISQKNFVEFLPPDFKLNFWNACAMTGRLYCGPLTARGLCTQTCDNCKVRLVKAMQIQAAVIPGALLTYTLRMAVAQAQEDNQLATHAEPRNTHPLGITTDANIFEDILRETR